MKSSKRKNKIFLLIILLLGLSIGFAMLSTTLKINGDTIIKKNKWKIYWSNLGDIKKSESVIENTPAVIDQNDDTLVSFSVTLDKPGDYYEFQVDATNSGTIDAMVDTISTIINDDPEVTLPRYIKYSIIYDDNIEINRYDLLDKADGEVPSTERYKIRIEFLRDISNEEYESIPSDGLSYTFDVSIPYVQADDNAKYRPGVFEIGSWDEIIAAYNNGNPNKSLQKSLKRGTTREIELDMDHDGTSDTTGHLRIANLSTPSECENSNFSQTACGFVVEFADVVTTHKMSYYDKNSYAHGEGEGTWGGYEKSDMRAYLNGYIYAYDGTNYSGVSYFDSLPSDLKDKLITTKISSSSNHGGSTSTSFVNDKMYLLSPREVWGNKVANADLEYDINFDKSRQLDYYDVIGAQADEDHWDKASKPVLNPDQQDWEGVPPEWSKGFWALREAYCNPSYDSSFYRVLIGGHIGWTYSVNAHGVSPAFRIAE